jgi:hypothetical protein
MFHRRVAFHAKLTFQLFSYHSSTITMMKRIGNLKESMIELPVTYTKVVLPLYLFSNHLPD